LGIFGGNLSYSIALMVPNTLNGFRVNNSKPLQRSGDLPSRISVQIIVRNRSPKPGYPYGLPAVTSMVAYKNSLTKNFNRLPTQSKPGYKGKRLNPASPLLASIR